MHEHTNKISIHVLANDSTQCLKDQQSSIQKKGRSNIHMV